MRKSGPSGADPLAAIRDHCQLLEMSKLSEAQAGGEAEVTPEVIEISGGEVRLWLEPDEPICIKTVGVDPVELTKGEAIQLANALLSLAAQVVD